MDFGGKFIEDIGYVGKSINSYTLLFAVFVTPFLQLLGSSIEIRNVYHHHQSSPNLVVIS